MVSLSFQQIKQKLADYCVYQDRSHKEVEKKMREFTLIPEAKDEIFLFLLSENFLNEERFAKSYCRGKFNQKRWGKNKIINGLKAKDISENLIKIGLKEIDEKEYEKIFHQLATKKWMQLKEGNIFLKKKKLQSFLYQRGYESYLIYDFFNDLK